MITDVKLVEAQCAIDFYELDEQGEPTNLPSNLVYTDDVYYIVEWHEEGKPVSTSEQRFYSLDEAMKFYKEMKAKEEV